jgi:C1A family cysteine protease
MNAVIKSPYDARDYTITAEKELPETFSLNTVPVKNQGTKPTCTAHALSSVVEYHHQRQHGEYVRFSTEFIYGLREDGYYMGDGMVIRNALNTLLKYGDVYESDCKGNHNVDNAMRHVDEDIDHLKELAYPHRISGYFRINNADELKTALMRFGVVVVSMKVYNWHRLVKDIYTYNPDRSYDVHCVFIYGWNKDGWLVQNSWGDLYGGDGRFVVPFDFKFNEMWGVADEITDGVIVKPKRNKILDGIYFLINLLVRRIKKEELL